MHSLSELILPRLPRRPYCSDELQYGTVVRPADQAITKTFIQLNPPVLKHWLVFDVDRQYAAFAWEWANLPPPNWAAINPQNSHAHLVYLLAMPVLTTMAGGLAHPLRYLAAIEAGMRLALKADPGYRGMLTKNPLHERWQTVEFHHDGYLLNDLAEYVELPKKYQTNPECPNFGLMRNMTLFDELRTWAYSWVLKFKDAGATLDYWVQALMMRAEAINQGFPVPLQHAEVRAVVRSVAKWVWRHFTEAEFREIQRARGRRSGVVRRQGSLEEQMPWVALGISRRTYFNRKKAGTLPESVALEPYQIPADTAPGLSESTTLDA